MDFNIFKKDKESPEHFWSLVIGKSWVDSGIWQIVDDKTEIVARGGSFSWQEDNPESLIEAADSSLTAAVSYLAESAAEPSRVVFGILSGWVEAGSIKTEYLGILRKLSGELEISPCGFVVIPEAIVHFLKSDEGVPPNIILVGLSEQSLDVTLSHNGKILGTVGVARSMSLSSDVAEGLARLPVVQYPTRLVLYDHRTVDMEEAKQSLLDADWQSSGISFLHTPKIEVLPDEVGILAVSLAGGAEVGQATSIVLAEEKKTSEAAEAPIPDIREIDPGELGFLRGGDIAQQDRQESKEEEKREETAWEGGQDQPEKKGQMIGKVRGLLSQLRLPYFKFPKRFGKAFAILLFSVLVVAAGILYWYLPRAQVTIYVAPKKLEKVIDFEAEAGVVSVNTTKKRIPGKTVNVDVQTVKKRPATGTKRVGEPAKGEVTVYRAGGSVVLPKGAILTSAGGLKFTLDGDVRVASGSAGPDTLGKNIDPARITASDIGADYNVAAGTLFKIGSFSSETTTAKNQLAFSGGTARDVLAVSAADRNLLKEEVEQELKSQAAGKILQKISGDEILIESSGETKLDKQEFSNKVGEEIDGVALTASGSVRFLLVSRADLEKLIMADLGGQVPEGFGLEEDQLRLDVAGREGKFTVRAQVNLLPKVNPDEIVRFLVGKQPSAAREYLSRIPGYTRAQISFRFRPPGPLGTLPHLPGNIVLEVVAEK